MSKLHDTFLQILACALKGEEAPTFSDLTEEDWMILSKIASEQKLLPLIFDAVYRQAPLQMLRNSVRQQVMLQTMKTDDFLRLYRKWNQEGIHPIVVKGIVCRSVYKKPDHRPSSDEDVLIAPDQIPAAMKVLEEFGMTTTKSADCPYELPYRKQNSPLYIELHKALFDPSSASSGDWNELFSHVFGNHYQLEIQGCKIRTLAPTDHILFLICHALKHFIHSGFGIRQICDIVLFANHFGAEIQWNALLRQCKQIHADIFAATIFQIGAKYLGLDLEKACYPKNWRNLLVDEANMLEDLFSGGVYGNATLGRVHSSNITLDAVAASKTDKKVRPSLIGSVFPGCDKLKGNYPYLRKYPFLLPVAWTQRLIRYGKDIKSGKTENAAVTIEIGNQRVELLRQYGVIK